MTRTLRSLGRLGPRGESDAGRLLRVIDSDICFVAVRPELLGSAFLADVAAQVAFRDALSFGERDELDHLAVWPLDTVVHRGRMVGYLLPWVPAPYFHTRLSVHGGLDLVANELTWLLAPTSELVGTDLDDRDLGLVPRLVMTARIARAVAWLHRRGRAFGDVGLDGVLFAVDPLGAVLAAPHPGRAVTVPGTDVRDLARLTLLVLTSPATYGGGSPTVRERLQSLAGTDPGLAELVEDCLALVPAQPRTAGDLYAALRRSVAAQTSPPRVHRLEWELRACPRGGDVRLRWRFEGADRVLIHTSDGLKLDVDPRQHPDGFSFAPRSAGNVTVRVSNRYAAAGYALGPIQFFEVPSLDPDALTLPRLPQLPRLDVVTELVPALPAAAHQPLPAPPDPWPLHDAQAAVAAVGLPSPTNLVDARGLPDVRMPALPVLPPLPFLPGPPELLDLPVGFG